ncbi:MAG: CotH kinase family protein, partial [Erysipelotrichaceae bacterium]|nr:CotH kinase family protein [Erysipelotrichaceae bacterium]
GRPGGMTDHYYENDLTVALFKSKQFRELWLERLAYNLKNVWSKENVLNRIDEIVALYRPEIERDRKRFGLTVSGWEREVDLLRDWVKKRQYYYLRDTKNYFGLSEARMKELFGDLW